MILHLRFLVQLFKKAKFAISKTLKMIKDFSLTAMITKMKK